MLDKIIYIVIGMIISVVVYFLKRLIEKKHIDESLDRNKKILEINKQLHEQGLTTDDLKKLEVILTRKYESRVKHSQEIENGTQSITDKTGDINLTQIELNIRADSNLKIAKARLDQVINELSLNIDDIQKDKLLQAQKTWEEFSFKQADASSISYRDGSIYPLIYLSELISLTNERTARLQVELDEIRRR